MRNADDSRKPVSTLAAGRPTSLARGCGWAVPFGVCGFFLPFAVLGLGTVSQIVVGDMTSFERSAELRELVRDGIPSAIVCSFIFAFSALASLSPSHSIGLIRSLIVMTSYAFVAIIAAIVLNTIFFFDRRNPKEATDLCEWLYLECQYLRVFPVTFLPGAVAFTHWQNVTVAGSIGPEQPRSSRIATLALSPVTLCELLVCAGLILLCIAVLRPVVSQSRAQLLAEGSLLENGQPVAGAKVEFYPVLSSGRVGEPTHQPSLTPADGRFLIVTFPEWRKTNPSVGEFAVTVDVRPGRIPGDEMDAIRSFASPQDTPIRVAVVEGKRSGIRIELGEWRHAQSDIAGQ